MTQTLILLSGCQRSIQTRKDALQEEELIVSERGGSDEDAIAILVEDFEKLGIRRRSLPVHLPRRPCM